MAGVVLILFAWRVLSNAHSGTTAFLVSDNAAILAGITAVISILSLIWVPKKHVTLSVATVYTLLTITIVLLILDTGGTGSPFLALWMAVGIFSGIFGISGVLPLFAAVAVYLIVQFMAGLLSRQEVIAVALAGELPLIISYMIWHTRAATSQTRDQAYHELATELSQVSSKAEVVINAIADGVIALDGQGIIQLINPAAQRLIGWGKQDALALNYKSVLKLVDSTDSEPEPAVDPIIQALANNKPIKVEDLRLVTNVGKKIQVSIVVSPVGQPGSGIIVVFRDVTNERAEERQQAEFISTASHEMRTPVASIEGYLGLALNPATATIDAKARDYIEKAHKSAEHLGELFQDLLDVSKADDGRIGNNPKVIDVVAFVGDIVGSLKMKADEKKLRMLFKPAPDDTAVEGSDRRISPVFYVNVDNDHLREVMANLIVNAIKYTPQGDVVVDVTGDNEHVTLSVADSGIGIPKEDQAHLFQKFYRVDNSDTREIGGTGLGLYLCRRLTEAMGGRIWVESEYKKGSTFYVELTRVSHEDATRMIEEAAEKPADAPAITPTVPLTDQPAQPVPATAPAPATPPAVATATQPQPAVAPVAPVPAHLVQSTVNIPITTIEQQPQAFTTPVRPTSGVAVPPRNNQGQQ